MKATLFGSLLVLLAATASGCSFAFVRGPPARPVEPDAKLECTTSRVAPIADLLAGVVSVLFGAALSTDPQFDGGFGEGTSAPVYFGLGAVWAASSIYGFLNTNRCSDAMDTQRACFQGQAEACRLLKESSPPTPRP